jgi:hypothetical protein
VDPRTGGSSPALKVETDPPRSAAMATRDVGRDRNDLVVILLSSVYLLREFMVFIKSIPQGKQKLDQNLNFGIEGLIGASG